MAGLREQKKRKTRATIIEAAVALFGERGYENTTIAALAEAAGVGKGTIYSYFRSKNEILLSFCEGELLYIHEEIRHKLTPEASLQDKMLLLFMSEFSYVTKNKEFGRTLMREMIFPRELMVQYSRKIEDQFIGMFIRIFKEAQEQGQLRCDLEMIMLCGHFYGMYMMALSAWYSGRLQTEDDVRESLKMMFDQALTGLLPATARNHESA
jgi:AcrR family transcriptional regulator